jgi:hypothetical protein
MQKGERRGLRLCETSSIASPARKQILLLSELVRVALQVQVLRSLWCRARHCVDFCQMQQANWGDDIALAHSVSLRRRHPETPCRYERHLSAGQILPCLMPRNSAFGWRFVRLCQS